MVQTCTAQSIFCSAPSDRSLENRKCGFGSLATYNNALKATAALTGCTRCANICAPCECEFNTSVISQEIDSELFCDQSLYCNNKNVIMMMNFLVANFNQYERQVLRIQPYLIELCGRVNGICCNGKCTQQYQVSIPNSMCDENKGTPGFIRWIMTVYVLIGIGLWQLASV